MISASAITVTFLTLIGFVEGHIAAWHKGMYCLNGTSGAENRNTNDAVNPLYDLPFEQWWLHAVNGCNKFPPAEGDFLELPAGGQFTVEMAENRAFTSLSYNGQFTSEWGDGKRHPEPYVGSATDPKVCITSPNLHTQNASMVAGSAFAISYTSNLSEVTPSNLVVFTVNRSAPFKRFATYDVPSDLPECPPGGCICAWGWIPNACGQANMYQLPYRCKVTGVKSTARPVGKGQAPVWCEDDPKKCVKGPKQMLYWKQHTGNNIVADGVDLGGYWMSPGYNHKCGFQDGAQNDIFVSSGSLSPRSSPEAISASLPAVNIDPVSSEVPVSTPSPSVDVPAEATEIPSSAVTNVPTQEESSGYTMSTSEPMSIPTKPTSYGQNHSGRFRGRRWRGHH